VGTSNVRNATTDVVNDSKNTFERMDPPRNTRTFGRSNLEELS
jgi:hypothetical protein